MSVTPLGLHAMIQRTNDVGVMKQQEDAKPAVEQHSIQSQQIKQEHDLTHKVIQAKEKENENFRYDAKEKGNGAYQKRKQKKKSGKEVEIQNETQTDGKVILKGQTSRFDMKI